MLVRLSLRDFRSFAAFELELTAPWQGIVGPNGAGKTNLLEAVVVVHRLRGFRHEPPGRLWRWGSDGGSIAVLWRGTADEEELELRARGRGYELRLDGDPWPARRTWVRRHPVFGYRPDDDLFFHERPDLRRRYLDWLCTYLVPEYLDDLGRYQRLLQQRNAALRAQVGTAELVGWETELAAAGARVVAHRNAVAELLAQRYAELATDVAQPFTVRYATEVPSGVDAYREVLAADRERDRERGWTGFGPHRDDLVVELAGRLAREAASQGQRKLAVILLALACFDVVARPEESLFYLDDVEGELDNRNEARLFELLMARPRQVLLTGVRRPRLVAELARDRVAWTELG